MFTSGTTGYYPNRTQVCIFDDFHGSYRDLGDPCIGDETGTTFHSQISCVLKLPGKDAYIACADRWIPEVGTREEARQEVEKYRKRFANYAADRQIKIPTPLPGKLQRHMENTSESRYVWLPIRFDGEKPVLRWEKAWNPQTTF